MKQNFASKIKIKKTLRLNFASIFKLRCGQQLILPLLLEKMFKNLPCRFVLGSTSPRRRDILKMVELEFVQKSPQFDESELMKRDDLSPDKLVQMIAEKKVKKKLKLI